MISWIQCHLGEATSFQGPSAKLWFEIRPIGVVEVYEDRAATDMEYVGNVSARGLWCARYFLTLNYPACCMIF